jgi:hypothetical protein
VLKIHPEKKLEQNLRKSGGKEKSEQGFWREKKT